MTAVVLIVAAGAGRRFGAPLPKQYHLLSGKAVLAHTLEKFLNHPSIEGVQVAIAAEDEEHYRQAIPPHAKLYPAVYGGNERSISVFNVIINGKLSI